MGGCAPVNPGGRSDQKPKAQERLESLLLEGLESGEAREFTAEDWAELKRRTYTGVGRKTPGKTGMELRMTEPHRVRSSEPL
jgi:uncharacterized protein YoaH (UPF0181 family)